MLEQCFFFLLVFQNFFHKLLFHMWNWPGLPSQHVVPEAKIRQQNQPIMTPGRKSKGVDNLWDFGARNHSPPGNSSLCRISAKDRFTPSKLKLLQSIQTVGGCGWPWHEQPRRPRELDELGLSAAQVLVLEVLAALAGQRAAKAQTAASHLTGI